MAEKVLIFIFVALPISAAIARGLSFLFCGIIILISQKNKPELEALGCIIPIIEYLSFALMAWYSIDFIF